MDLIPNITTFGVGLGLAIKLLADSPFPPLALYRSGASPGCDDHIWHRYISSSCFYRHANDNKRQSILAGTSSNQRMDHSFLICLPRCGNRFFSWLHGNFCPKLSGLLPSVLSRLAFEFINPGIPRSDRNNLSADYELRMRAIGPLQPMESIQAFRLGRWRNFLCYCCD